jgi:uncharacterized membrane protein
VAYALYAVFRHWHFQSGGYDLGIFDQAVWHLSRFETPASTIAGHSSIFGDHFHPVLILLAPLYWILPRPETLLVAQAILLAGSLVPVFLYSRARVNSSAGLWIAASYGLFWGMQKAAAFDFHEVAFAPLVIATAILALEERRWSWFWISALVICCIKEDLIPLIGMFGVRLMMSGEVRRGIAAVGLSVVAFTTVMMVVMPALGNENTYPYWSTHQEALKRGLPSLLMQLVTPVGKLQTVMMWVVPFAFLPLRSPLVLLTLPLVLARLLSGNADHWGTAFHYSAPLAPILAMAAADGLARCAEGRAPEVRRALLRVAPVVMFVLCAVLPGRLPLWRVLAPAHYRSSNADRTGYEALATIPDAASVAAQDALIPHLSRRQRIYELERGAPDTDYVIVTEHRTAWPHHNFEDIRDLLNEHQARGYVPVFERDGWVVLSRRPVPRF